MKNMSLNLDNVSTLYARRNNPNFNKKSNFNRDFKRPFTSKDGEGTFNIFKFVNRKLQICLYYKKLDHLIKF
jgi:hypothetical protein